MGHPYSLLVHIAFFSLFHFFIFSYFLSFFSFLFFLALLYHPCTYSHVNLLLSLKKLSYTQLTFYKYQAESLEQAHPARFCLSIHPNNHPFKYFSIHINISDSTSVGCSFSHRNIACHTAFFYCSVCMAKKTFTLL